MKHANNRRSRGRSNGKRYPNQRGGVFESNGPEVKVRGTPQQVQEKYLALARDAQVLVVTHSPQVAALGQHHWRVEKRVTGDVTTSSVVPLDPAARIDEIARMLSGDTITDEARGAARALLTG